jgi:hypothetical protein
MNCAYRRHTWIALACSLLGAGCASQTTALSALETSPTTTLPSRLGTSKPCRVEPSSRRKPCVGWVHTPRIFT